MKRGSGATAINRKNPASPASGELMRTAEQAGAAVTNLENYALNTSAGANADWLTFRGRDLSSKHRIANCAGTNTSAKWRSAQSKAHAPEWPHPVR